MLTDDGRTTDGQRTDDGVTGILIAHLGAFSSGELKYISPDPEGGGGRHNYRLMQVKSIADCSKGSILQYF